MSKAETASIPVHYRRGVYLPEPDLWLDPSEPKPFAFVSHAHADHFARHEHILCSEPTRTLIQARYGKGKATVTSLAFGEEWEHEGHRIKLIPAGHILGSAQIHLTRLRDGASLVYTGDFKLRPGLSSERCETMAADTVIMETTYGLPRYVFPPTTEVLAEMVKWVRESLEEGLVPILIGYSLGKSQEILSALTGADVTVALHESVFRMCKAYEKVRSGFPAYELLDPTDTSGKVLIVPPSVARSQAIRRLRKKSTAMLSGWATDAGARFRYQVDQVFPLSDHADYPDLVRYVEMVKPQRVLTLHGYAREFARDLRDRGVEAWSLIGENQMDLPLRGASNTSPEAEVPAEPPHPGGSFGAWVEVCEEVAKTTGRTRKVELLADYFRDLPEEQLTTVASWFGGRAFPRRSEQGQLQVGWATIRKALQEAAGIDDAAYQRISISQNDPGRTAYLVLLQGRGNPQAQSTAGMAGHLETLRNAR